MYYFVIAMKTFSIQLIFTYICLSNADYYGENHVMVQRQMSFEPKNDTTWDGIMQSWNKIFWSNQNFEHGDYAPRVRTRLITKSSKFAGFNSRNRFCTYLGAIFILRKDIRVGGWSRKWQFFLYFM